MPPACRDLILVLGDQLDRRAEVLRAADPARDRVLMIEARSESRRVRSHSARTTLFLTAMRRHADWLRGEGFEVVYVDIDRPEAESFESGLEHTIERLRPAPLPHPPDDLGKAVRRSVREHFPDNPGSAERFNWPTTREQAQSSLKDFVAHRLADFGRYQDAMWEGSPWLYHSALSTALNLKLLHPSEVITAVLEAYRDGHAPLNAVEGFVRQVLGWREYVRGIYWSEGEDYLARNALQAEQPLPGLYWTADTEMACLRDVISQVLAHGYAHHIQRLMVTGLFALLLGVRPQQLHQWFLATHVDAIEWVEAPNTLGMSQYGDGGLLASKPYAASGRYIQRMSNHCS